MLTDIARIWTAVTLGPWARARGLGGSCDAEGRARGPGPASAV